MTDGQYQDQYAANELPPKGRYHDERMYQLLFDELMTKGITPQNAYFTSDDWAIMYDGQTPAWNSVFGIVLYRDGDQPRYAEFGISSRYDAATGQWSQPAPTVREGLHVTAQGYANSLAAAGGAVTGNAVTRDAGTDGAATGGVGTDGAATGGTAPGGDESRQDLTGEDADQPGIGADDESQREPASDVRAQPEPASDVRAQPEPASEVRMQPEQAVPDEPRSDAERDAAVQHDQPTVLVPAVAVTGAGMAAGAGAGATDGGRAGSGSGGRAASANSDRDASVADDTAAQEPDVQRDEHSEIESVDVNGYALVVRQDGTAELHVPLGGAVTLRWAGR